MVDHAFRNASNIRRSLGAGDDSEVLLPDETKNFDPDYLVGNDIDEINEGFIQVTPDLPAEMLAEGSVGNQIIKLKAEALGRSKALVFVNAPGPIAGVINTPLEVEIKVVSGNGNVATMDDVTEFTVTATGSAVIAESMPLTVNDGSVKFNVTNAVAEISKFELTGVTSPASLDSSSELEVQFV